MPSTVLSSPTFRKNLKRLQRKFPKVEAVVDDLIQRLKADARPGDLIPGIGSDVYKVRLENPSANRGKSGGFRAIYYVWLAERVILLTIYSKTEQSDISPEQILSLLDEIENIDEPDENNSTDSSDEFLS